MIFYVHAYSGTGLFPGKIIATVSSLKGEFEEKDLFHIEDYKMHLGVWILRFRLMRDL